MKANQQSKRVEAARANIDPLKNPFLPVAAQLGFPDEFLVAMSATTALVMLGVRARLVAGSARWLLMSDEEQGEALLTQQKPLDYFGYEFSLTEALTELVTMHVPESMHVWTVDDSGTIYDFTGEDQMSQFESLCVHSWPAARRLPPAIVGTSEDLQVNGWFYEEDEQATSFALRLVQFLMFNALRQQTQHHP